MTTPAWENVSDAFMMNDKPYGGGAFRIRGDEVITLKFAGPEIKFKPRNERKNPDVAEPIEPWMSNAGETLNRSTASFIRGTLDSGMTRYFQQQAQDGAWWYSKDWAVQYISTGWMDFTRQEPVNGLAPQITRLWRSIDGGRTWTQLKWPEDRNISYLKFLDPQRGYAIGWGPNVWRTADGGQTWQAIALPPMATDYRKPRKQFDAVDLGPDGLLRVAYYVGMLGEVRLSSVVYRLPWDKAQFEPDVVLPDQVVVRLGSTEEPPGHTYSIYALSRLGPQQTDDDQNDNGKRTGAISMWPGHRNPAVRQLQTFDERYSLTDMDVGKRGVLLVYAGDSSRRGAPHQITLYSQDYGKSWKDIDDGMTQGGWFDSLTNTQYALYAYTLRKRQF
ncbi:WD40/YVTN/BNR-like repeat-containing protein [Paraburkholderia humisilvae]|uniref:WD40/YVTN/BNR-like repeat-containing protein n=3 Tax=Paraburkholderia humisilvae TaxID=627669 RepID=UPI003617F127